MRAIYGKELRAYFKSPLGYIFIAVVMALFGIYYSMVTLKYGVATYGSTVLANVCGLLTYLIPLLTMRSFSEESKNRTDQLLLTSPIRVSDIVLGKFFAMLTIVGGTLLLTFIFPMFTKVNLGGTVDWAMTFGGYLATFLLCAAFIALGMYFSSITESQFIAVLISLAAVVLLNLLNGVDRVLPSSELFSLVVFLVIFAGLVVALYFLIKDVTVTAIVAGAGIVILVGLYLIAPAVYEGLFGKVLSWLNIMQRFGNVYTGSFQLGDVVFFFGFTAFFLFLTQQRLEKKRWD